jgi:hypothetical protein
MQRHQEEAAQRRMIGRHLVVRLTHANSLLYGLMPPTRAGTICAEIQPRAEFG